MTRDKKLELLSRALKKTFGDCKSPRTSSPFELMVMTVLSEGTSHAAGLKASKALMREFVDWNEVRVSSWKEIGVVLERQRLPHPGEKGLGLKRSLEAVFSETNHMDLAVLEKLAPEKASTFLTRLRGLDEGALAALLYSHLGTKILQPTATLLRVSLRIGFIQKNSSIIKMKQALKDFVRRHYLLRFHSYLSKIGERFCFEKVTFCEKCPALAYCDHGSAHLSRLSARAKKSSLRKGKAKKAKAQPKAKPKTKTKAKPKAKTPVKKAKPKTRAKSRKPAKPVKKTKPLKKAKPAKKARPPKSVKPKKGAKPAKKTSKTAGRKKTAKAKPRPRPKPKKKTPKKGRR